ncbi:threonine synthase [Parasphingorhabdus sp. DH2-15]|uniref:threonine synthase n=1 Tax=Parasphingorhabdus sp. DH2-15 TaxID=3444112 RepID=UPI003F68235D
MEYISTRGQSEGQSFRDVTLAGLGSDGGLYVPKNWPRFDMETIASWAGLPYADLACRIMQPFIGDSLTDAQLKSLCDAAYGGFSHDAVAPLVQIDQQHWLLELFHGPTLAFKDVALQLLGGLFEEFMQGSGKRLTIIGATSGDTGSAAIHAVAGRAAAEIFMLHPSGRISDVQRRQMTTVLAPNVHNIAIEGSFDDAQAMVKRMFNDPHVNNAVHVSAVNSINWARLMAQIVYYFAAALQLGGPHRKIAFSVPTGNFGDVFAGYVAHKMGLPIERLIVATNRNDILDRAISSGDYSRSALEPTAAPSMDIQVSSNFERLLFDMVEQDSTRLADMMQGFEATNRLTIDSDIRERITALFSSAAVQHDDLARTIDWAYRASGELLDPHTAIGLAAARDAQIDTSVPLVTLATAHPAKFPDAVERACGIRPVLPGRIGDLFDRQEKFKELPGDYDAVAAYILAQANSDLSQAG